jgi:two-component system OmpR family response regulator
MPKATILTVDDDKNLQIVIQHYLEDDGYKVIAAESGKELAEKISGVPVDVVLLDLTLPDAEGLNLIATIRRSSTARIIIVSGKTETTEKIIGLEMGADDYITKPFEMRELSARIKAVLRRNADKDNEGPANANNAAKADKLFFEGWCLDRTQYQLFDKDGTPAGLTTGEFKLLEALVMAPNRALSREFLFELTRDSDNFDSYDRAIDIQIARIRKKMGEGPQNAVLIRTIRGVGYMFCSDVKTA